MEGLNFRVPKGDFRVVEDDAVIRQQAGEVRHDVDRKASVSQEALETAKIVMIG
jgi:hypothetical protein